MNNSSENVLSLCEIRQYLSLNFRGKIENTKSTFILQKYL